MLNERYWIASRKTASSDAWNRTAFYFLGTLPATRGYIRRHLSTGQRAAIVEKLANLPHGGDRKSGDFKGGNPTLKRSKAAKQLGTTPEAISR
jgi:hypothetical protein